jgi:hypothetical protein
VLKHNDDKQYTRDTLANMNTSTTSAGESTCILTLPDALSTLGSKENTCLLVHEGKKTTLDGIIGLKERAAMAN